MTIVAPPRPTEPIDRDELEALIEEARRRARRRRLMLAAATATFALVGVAVFAVFGRGASSDVAASARSGESGLAAGPAGSRIAFISGPRRCPLCTGPAPDHLRGAHPAGALYVMNADGSGRRVVARDVWPRVAWSPDGEKIAFRRNSEINVINADGTGERRLTRGAFLPAWSPDGRKIAFTRSFGGNEVSEVHVMNADGSGQRRLTHGALDMMLAWLPDGRIAFVRIVSARFPGNFELYVINADGSGQRNLTREWGLDGRVDRGYLWSPNGRKIAFTSTRDGNVEVYVMNADGSGQHRLTRSRADEGSLAWSPDGRKIAFVVRAPADNAGNYQSDIYVMNADGSGQRRLTRRGAQPRWSPDGRMIAFLSERDGNPELYVMNADGSGQRRLTRTPTRAERHFAWSR
jgi:Tol biopolymer transport system component